MARGAGRTVAPAIAGLGVVVTLLGVMAMISPGDEWQRLRELAGLERRVGQPPTVTGSGSFRFAATQRGSDEPVGYDPCRPVRWEINLDGAPEDGEELVATGFDRIAAATGLSFTRVGTTDDRDFHDDGRAFGNDPVLVGWADDDEVSQLEGDVVGLAGSSWRSLGAGRREYVTGSVVLERDYFADADPTQAQAVVDHELAHLVGLAHVDDPRELMHERGVTRTSFGAGDLEGLAELGGIRCG